MYNNLRNNINRKVHLTEDEFEVIEKVVRKVICKKKEKVLKEGNECNFSIFVNKGCARLFSVNNKGDERSLAFAFEDYWMADLYSYITGKPAGLTIDCIEDSELLFIYKEDMEALYLKVPQWERFMRLQFQNAYVATQNRLNAALSISAEERYVELLNTFPNIITRVPLVHISSYLGITPESLSRIRRTIVRGCPQSK